MSTSIAVLKVLSSYPDGRASLEALKADLAMLATREWTARMRRLAARAGAINLFTDKLARRDSDGWVITDAGRRLVAELEAEPAPAKPQERVALRLVSSKAADTERERMPQAMERPQAARKVSALG